MGIASSSHERGDAATQENRLLPILLELNAQYEICIKRFGLGLHGNYLPPEFVPALLKEQAGETVSHPVVVAGVSREAKLAASS